MKLFLFHGLPGSAVGAEATATGLPVVGSTDRRSIGELLHGGTDFAVIDQRLSAQALIPLVEVAHAMGAAVEHVHVDAPVELCREHSTVPEQRFVKLVERAYSHDRKHLRTFHHRVSNGKAVVWQSRDVTHPDEIALTAFNRVMADGVRPAGREAVIFDMDGTLADVSELVTSHLGHGKRDYHGFHTASEFAPANRWVVDAAQEAADAGRAVLVVTARQARYVGGTTRWLVRHNVPVTKLYMRGHDDLRADYEAKRDIAADIVADGFDVVHAFDDNPNVLRLWSELGIPTTTVPAPQWH